MDWEAVKESLLKSHITIPTTVSVNTNTKQVVNFEWSKPDAASLQAYDPHLLIQIEHIVQMHTGCSLCVNRILLENLGIKFIKKLIKARKMLPNIDGSKIGELITMSEKIFQQSFDLASEKYKISDYYSLKDKYAKNNKNENIDYNSRIRVKEIEDEALKSESKSQILIPKQLINYFITEHEDDILHRK